MSFKTRSQDSNISRKANSQYHQLEKNIFEQNHFSSIAVVESVIDEYWCSVRIIPSVGFNQFEASVGYTQGMVKNARVKAFMSMGLNLAAGHVVLVTFTDVDFRQSIIDIINGRNKFFEYTETSQTKNALNFGVITNRLL